MSSSNKKIVLVSSDGESFEIEETIARKLKTIANIIDDDCADNPIPLTNVTGDILAIIIDYCIKQKDVLIEEEEEEEEEEMQKKAEDHCADYLKKHDIGTLFKIITAANYLNIKSLIDLTSQAIADYIKDKTVDEVREIFPDDNVFTPEEDAELRQANPWAFE